MRKLILSNYQSPGDFVMLTAAVRDLHLRYPGEFLTDVRSPCPQLWKNNPYLTPLEHTDSSGDYHPPVERVIDLRGKTDLRQLTRCGIGS